jgi:hypothetical protein
MLQPIYLGARQARQNQAASDHLRRLALVTALTANSTGISHREQHIVYTLCTRISVGQRPCCTGRPGCLKFQGTLARCSTCMHTKQKPLHAQANEAPAHVQPASCFKLAVHACKHRTQLVTAVWTPNRYGQYFHSGNLLTDRLSKPVSYEHTGTQYRLFTAWQVACH